MGGDGRLNFVNFVVCSDLIVAGGVVAWSKRSFLGPAVIAFFVFFCIQGLGDAG